MKNALDWIKNNIMADIAILIVLLSIGFMVFFYLKGAELQERMAERNKAVTNIASYMKQRLQVPSEDPNLPPREVTGLTIKPATIEAVKQIQDRMGTEARQTINYLRQKNQAGHVLLLEGMLPETKAAFNARENYIQAFQDLLKPYDPEAPYIGLNAGLPLSSAEIEVELQKVRDQYTQLAASGAAAPVPAREQPGRTGRFDQYRGEEFDQPMRRGTGGENLTAETQQRLYDALVARLKSLLEERASSIDIYADPRLWTEERRKNPYFPFQIASWAIDDNGNMPGVLPTAEQLYEGQLEFWIQQDIARAIAIANRVDSEDSAVNVLTAPVKRLIQLDVLPGYIGLHGETAATARAGMMGADPEFRGSRAGALGQGAATATAPTLYPEPPAGALGNPDKPLPDNFQVSPTGRVSNVLYDVRHARLSIVADAAQLPTFFDALSDVNLMTVIDMQITDVDEWAALTEGYLYRGDAVQVDLLIETIWLRDWLRELMPSGTRRYLGVTTPGTERTNR